MLLHGKPRCPFSGGASSCTLTYHPVSCCSHHPAHTSAGHAMPRMHAHVVIHEHASRHACTHPHPYTHTHACISMCSNKHSLSLTHRKSRWGGGQIFDTCVEGSRWTGFYFGGLGAPGDTPGFSPERLKPARVPRGAASPPIYPL